MKALLAAVVLIGLAAVLGAAVTGSLVFEGTVVERPYERGIAWDEERETRRESGITTSLGPGPYTTGGGFIDLQVRESSGEPLGEERIGLRLSRPETSSRDRTYGAFRQPDGSFKASVDLPLRGRWYADVLVERGGRQLAFRHEIYVANRAGEPPAERPPLVDCLFEGGACRRDDGAGTTVAFAISPRPVRTMTDLLLRVRLTRGEEPVEEGQVVVDLAMPGMYMGENRIVLRPLGEGVYEGEGVIVKCPSGRKVWRATVSSPSTFAADFTFLVDQ